MVITARQHGCGHIPLPQAPANRSGADAQNELRGELTMNAQEKANYIRGAVDASPHKIAIISAGNSITVAWRDEKGNLLFANAEILKEVPTSPASAGLPSWT